MVKLGLGNVLTDKYEPMKILGKGSTGQVILGKNRTIGNLVAIKIAPLNQAQSLRHEIDLLKELHHHAIPLIMDVLEDEQHLYMVMEYVEGENLTRFRGDLKEQVVMEYLFQLISVFSYLHNRLKEPLLYLDLKPSNIILQPSGQIKLIDFGIARYQSYFQNGERNGYGTRGYAAPEQFTRSPLTVRTDIFSLGVLVHDLFTGENLGIVPYRLSSLAQKRPDISRHLVTIIERCYQREAALRFQTMDHLYEALVAVEDQRQAMVDFHIFRQHCNKMILLTGTRHGMGVTHWTYLIGAYYQKRDKKVALVEYNHHGAFTKVAYQMDNIKEFYEGYRHRGMDHYPYDRPLDYEKVLDGHYDVIIIDGGLYDDLERKGGVNLADEVLIIAGSKDWEIEAIDVLIMENQLEKFSCFLQYSQEHKFKEMKDTYQEIDFYLCPYNPSPYEPNIESMHFLESVFRHPPYGSLERKSPYEVWKQSFLQIYQKIKALS